MKKVLVAVADYPNNCGGKKLMYVHVRNKYYQENNIEVTVLNFKTNVDYVYEGVSVISKDSYLHGNRKFEILVCHAPNLRNHLRFIMKNVEKFNKFIFVFHGHEILKLTKDYSAPYGFLKKNYILKRSFQKIYDNCKLMVWRCYFPKISHKTNFVFVSNWLYTKFKEYIKFDPVDRTHVINNSVGKLFEQRDYKYMGKKTYDFITIRSNFDSSTYCLDLLTTLAQKYENYSFLLIGKGNYYDYCSKPDNLQVVDSYLSHEEMLDYIDDSQCALMLTRNDTQGVMSCELATYGIPVITSDIEVCREIFNGFAGVKLVKNECEEINLPQILEEVKRNIPYKKNTKYLYNSTVKKEIDLINKIY